MKSVQKRLTLAAGSIADVAREGWSPGVVDAVTLPATVTSAEGEVDGRVVRLASPISNETSLAPVETAFRRLPTMRPLVRNTVALAPTSTM